jgi:signal transduction histidine kinase
VGTPSLGRFAPFPHDAVPVENHLMADAVTVEGSAGEPQDPAQARRRWPWVAFAVFLITFVAGMAFHVLNGQGVVTAIPFVVAFTMFAVVGLVVVTRDARNRVGLLLLVGSLIMVVCSAAGDFATWALSHGDEGPAVAITGLLTNFGWLLGLLAPLLLIPVLFPDGRLPSPRWRAFVWSCALFLSVIGLHLLLGQRLLGGSGDDVGVRNPLYVASLDIPLDPLIALLMPILFSLSVLSLIQRFRRSTGMERQQIKWVAFGLPLSVVLLVLSMIAGEGTLLGSVFGGASYLVFPVTIGIAILRFRLYDLGLVVRKTLLYAILAAFITLVYVGIVVGVGAIVGSGDSQNLALSVVATAIVAVGFQPVRARAERFANRLVYGRRATPYEILAEFSGRMGEAYEDDDVLPRMSRVLGEGIGAEHAEVWLYVSQELRVAASWPADAGHVSPVSLTDGDLPELPGADAAYPVTHQGELLGALTVTKRASDPLTPADLALVSDLADQAGLVLRNVRLTEDLRARLDDLTAAQTRIVRAQDEERRKLERNIHDGAQQQLVALAVKLRLADALVGRDEAGAHGLLRALQTEVTDALNDLRDLARGIYPPVLADKGLAAALDAQARKAAVPTTVAADGVGRYSQDVEATVYFSCLEALQNVAKYADATAASVTLRRDDGMLEFTVTDDGRGFDPATTGYGTGLQGIADRVAVTGGTVEVRSSPGQGTSLRGWIPVVASDADGITESAASPA